MWKAFWRKWTIDKPAAFGGLRLTGSPKDDEGEGIVGWAWQAA
jgi:hypothetical protein